MACPAGYGPCAGRASHRRCQAWVAAGVCLAWYRHGLAEDDALQGIDWQWLARDGFMTKAPIGGKRSGGTPPIGGARHQMESAHRRRRRAYRPGRRGDQPSWLHDGPRHQGAGLGRGWSRRLSSRRGCVSIKAMTTKSVRGWPTLASRHTSGQVGKKRGRL